MRTGRNAASRGNSYSLDEDEEDEDEDEDEGENTVGGDDRTTSKKRGHWAEEE